MPYWLRAAPTGIRRIFANAIRRHRADRLSGLPTWMLVMAMTLMIVLLGIAILYEPLNHREQLPYYHPPGMPSGIAHNQ